MGAASGDAPTSLLGLLSASSSTTTQQRRRRPHLHAPPCCGGPRREATLLPKELLRGSTLWDAGCAPCWVCFVVSVTVSVCQRPGRTGHRPCPVCSGEGAAHRAVQQQYALVHYCKVSTHTWPPAVFAKIAVQAIYRYPTGTHVCSMHSFILPTCIILSNPVYR